MVFHDFLIIIDVSDEDRSRKGRKFYLFYNNNIVKTIIKYICCVKYQKVYGTCMQLR